MDCADVYLMEIATQFLLWYNSGVYYILYSEGLHIIKRLSGVLKHTKALGNFDSILMLSLTVSIFLPFYITLACMIFVVIVSVIQKKSRKAIFLNPSNLFLMSIMLYGIIVSSIYANYTGIMYSLVFLAALIVMFYGKTIMTRKLFDNMMDAACFTSVICVPIAAIQMFWFPGVTVDGRPPSTFTNANYYGMIIEFVVIIAMYRIFTTQNLKMRKWYVGAILINLIGLYMSMSMSSCMTLCLTMLIYLMIKGKKKSATVLFLFIAIIAFALLSGQIFPRIDTTTEIFRVRIDVWSTALQGIADHALFGMGPSAYQLVWPVYSGYPTFHAHNLFLDTLLNFGVIGGCAIFFYVLTQLKLLMKRFQIRVCRNRNILVLVMFAAVLIHGCTDVTIFWVQTGMLFLLVYTSTGIQNNAKSFAQKKRKISIHHTQVWSAEEHANRPEKSGESKSDIHNSEVH